MSRRILLAGLFHETHTFLDGTTPLDDFAIREGDEILATRNDGSPLSGVLEVADQSGWDVRPAIDLRATPSAIVEDAVVEHFWRAFAARYEKEALGGIDGIYLVLHGAMAAQSTPDVEGEILERIRSLPGAADIPICGVLDLHGNISRQTCELSDGFVAYRHNPHTDARAAAIDGAKLLEKILTTGTRPAFVWERPPIIWPPTGTGTADEPMLTLEAMARRLEDEQPEIAAVNVFGGFSFADTPDTGVSLSAVTFGDPHAARGELRKLAAWVFENRERGNKLDPPLADVLPEILSCFKTKGGPVVIVEPADNIGGGAPGDATTILSTLIENHVENSAVIINDAEAVNTLQTIQPGENLRMSIGGRGSQLSDGPVELDVKLLSTSDGRFELEDRNSHLASMHGVHIDMGPCAVVRHGSVRILLTSNKTPPFDLGQLRSQGIEPEQLSLVGVKAAVAHRRAYEPIQSASFTVSTPGPCSSDVGSFPYEKVERPVYPLDAI